MGVMGKFRDNTGVVLWILIGSFGLLWVIMDVFDPNALSAGPRALGSVNGEPISFDEYNSRVQYYSNAYTQQTGASMTAETRAVYENQVWDDLVNAQLLEQKMNELGITVTDQELLDMAYGDNPDPLISQYFAREDGTIDRFMVQNVLQDEQYSQEAIAIELQLRQKRRQQKLSNFITAGLQVTDQDVMNEYIKRNSFAEFSFVRFPFNEVEESEISVSDSELSDYYNENKDRYKREESYRAKFVAFSTLPTKEDTTQIIKEVSDLSKDFAAAEDDSLFMLRQQSTTPYNNVFVAKADLREDYAPVLDIEVGAVTEVLNLGTTAAIIKKVDENRNEIKFAVLSKIFEALPSTIDDAAENADEFQYFASEESSFDEEAERAGLNVQEIFATKGSAFISGLGSSQQAMDFFRGADEGDISTPIELASQFVVIKLDEKTPEGFRPLDEVRAQVETQVKNDKRKAVTLANVTTMLGSNSSLEELSSASSKEMLSMDNLAASSTVITGAGREPGVIGAIFTMESGEVSGAVTGLNAIYVVEIKSITRPDPSTLDSATAGTLRAELEQQENQRYLGIWLEELKEEADITDNRSRALQ
ncbi:MAG: peptidyl-prolyl cis-trans isomerase [Balneolaceae bacterium]